MKRLTYVLLVTFLSLTSIIQVAAQGGDTGGLIKGSISDANYLAEGYLSPMMKAIGVGLNQGWYNTAKTHKKLGVDLTISVAAVTIPSSDRTFVVDNNRLESIDLVRDQEGSAVTPGTGSGNVPTVFGPSVTQSQYRYRATGSLFDGAPGFDLKKEIGVAFLPVPVVNLGIGLPKNIDLKIRYIPSIDAGDNQFDYFGIGIMHDVKQYIPGIKLLPLDLAGFVGYTRMSLTNDFDKAQGQTGEFVATATTVQALASKKVSILTVYGGLGYNIATTSLKAKGDYDLDGQAANGAEAKDPIDIKVSASGPRATVGMRLKLAVITLHGDYTFQKYSTLTVGFGIAVR